MTIREIDENRFDEYAKNHPLKNFYQSKEYGKLMSHSDFSVMYIAAFNNDIIVGASLILYKNIAPTMKYGYAPRGFLIDYYNFDLVKAFTKEVKDFFFKRGFAFLKINPEVSYSQLDLHEKSKTINPKSEELVSLLKKSGYDKLKDNLYFESLLPKYTPVIYLPEYNINSLDTKILDSVHNCELSGLKLISSDLSNIDKCYSFINDKGNKTITYYKYLYSIFSESNMIDILLVKLDYNTYVKFLQKKYIYEQENNDKINNAFNNNPKDMDLYNKKMKSDEELQNISSDIIKANDKISINDEDDSILGSAIVIKHEGRVTVLISGNSYNHESLDVKTFMYYKIIEEYKKSGYLFMDLNGITADFSDNNPYKELNEFKLKFNPNVYEYIGEFDLVVNKPFHQLLWSTNKIQNEFYKPAIKK